jgi:hypothetical protein
MLSGPKEKYTAADLDFKNRRFKFNNRFMWLLAVIAVCSFIACSVNVSAVAEHLLSGELRNVESVLGEPNALFLADKPTADRTAHHVRLPGKKQVHHQAEEHKLIPQDTQGSGAIPQDVSQDNVEFQDQEVGNTKREQAAP